MVVIVVLFVLVVGLGGPLVRLLLVVPVVVVAVRAVTPA
jgi:hypothetical protein